MSSTASVWASFMPIAAFCRSSRAFSLRNCSNSACSGVFSFLVAGWLVPEAVSSPASR
jgi:hypothetical protein